MSITIPEKMKKPIMVYYQVNDLRQNHRFYMENKSDKQLKGEEVSKEDLEKNNICENSLYNKDGFSYGNLPEDDIAFPCGLIAKSYFQDTFTLYDSSNNKINITTEGIAYKSDRDSFAKIEHREDNWTDVHDEHFMIWMRISPFENPRKLYGKIEQNDLSGGTTIRVEIKNNNYRNFEKYIIFSTRNVFGGKSSFLGICYTVFGAICLISAVIFINVYNYFHKKPKN